MRGLAYLMNYSGMTSTLGLALAACSAARTDDITVRVDRSPAQVLGPLTVAVLGTGIDQVYPRDHKNLAQEILASGGALVTQFPLQTPPVSENLPPRKTSRPFTMIRRSPERTACSTSTE